MDAKVELVVKPVLLRSIGQAWNGPLSQISPLLYEKEGQAPVDKRALLEASICDKEGKIQDIVRPAIEVLATAKAFTRIYLTKSPGNIFEYLVYMAQDGRTASIINDTGVLRINFPASNDEVFVGIGQLVGSSVLRNCEFSTDLTAGEALVFSAMMDLQRKAFLRALSDDKEQVPVQIDIDKIASLVSEGETDLQRFVSILKEMLAIHGTFLPEVVVGALEGLMAKGLAKREGKTCSLVGPALQLSRRFLLLERYLTVTAARLDDANKLEVASFTCLQSGINDILMIDAGEGTARLETLSSARLLDLLGVFMRPGKLSWPVRSTGRVSIGSSRT
jgi:hypothetical protein